MSEVTREGVTGQVATNLGLTVDRDVVVGLRRRHQKVALFEPEVFLGTPPGGAMDAVAGLVASPAAHPLPCLLQADKVLAPETGAAAVANGVFDPRFVGRPPHPSRVNCEAAGLGIVQECQVEPRRQGSA